MKRFLLGILSVVALTSVAFAQQIAPGQVLGNDTASPRPARGASIDAILDQALGATANRVVCNLTGTWQSCAQPILGSVGTMGTIAFLGSTSGTVTLTPQAVAGTPTLTFPNASGTFAVSGTAPVAVSGTTGAISINTNGISNSLFRQSVALSVVGNPTNATADVQDIAAGADANIMRRAGTAIGFGSIDLQSANAVGTSLLRMVNGGCNAALTASNGGLLYSTATGCAILAGTATAGQIPRSGSSSAPSWSTATFPATTAAGTVLYSASANTVAGSATPVLGVPGSLLGTLGLAGNTSGAVTIQPQAAAGTYNFNLPTSAGTSGQPLLSGGGAGAPQTYGTLGIAAGGTSQTTAQAARAGTGLNVESMATTGDANVAIASTTRTQATTTTLTAARTWTLPAANALNAGQTLTISDKAGAINGANTITVQRAGADTINGSTSFAMTSQYANVTLISDGVSVWNYATASGGSGTVTSVDANAGAKTAAGTAITVSGTVQLDQNYQGFGTQNCTLAASAAGSALTIALKDNAGNDPSATSPCNVNFRNVTPATGSTTALQVTAATSLTISSGSTLGVTSATGFNVWVVIFNDAGTARLGAYNASSVTATQFSIFPLAEQSVASSTAEGGAGGADSAGVFYTGTAVTSKAYRTLGRLEWSSSGLTAGTWTTTNLLYIHNHGTGMKLPGDRVQRIFASSSTQTSTASTTFVSGTLSASITPTSAANFMSVKVVTGGVQLTAGAGVLQKIGRGGCATLIGSTATTQDNTTAVNAGNLATQATDAPNTTAATSYNTCFRANTANTITGNNFNDNNIEIEEIQG